MTITPKADEPIAIDLDRPFSPEPWDSLYTAKEVKIGKGFEPGNWVCYMVGGKDGITYRPAKGLEPNGFHRLMHRLIFGAKWVRLDGRP